MGRTKWILGLMFALLTLSVAACGDGDDGEDLDAGDMTSDSDGGQSDEDGDDSADDTAASGPITVYSGRSEELVSPAFERFTEATGIAVEVRYGDTAEMAATILEEGDNSPADVFFGQDAGALGALKEEGRLADLPDDIVGGVDPRFADPAGQWVGVTGRARVVAFNTEALGADDLPDSILDFADDAWEGRVGWAPPNGSLQAHITAMRVQLGDDVVGDWLEKMGEIAVDYDGNTPILEALGRGEIDAGITNHYYLYRFLAENPDFPVENAFLAESAVDNLVNVAGAGVVNTSENQEAAFELMRYLLSEETQQYFAGEVFEFPLVPGIEVDPRLPSMEDIDTPDIDLSDLSDLQGTLELMQERGALP